jgi:hypothetical protein
MPSVSSKIRFQGQPGSSSQFDPTETSGLNQAIDALFQGQPSIPRKVTDVTWVSTIEAVRQQALNELVPVVRTKIARR